MKGLRAAIAMSFASGVGRVTYRKLVERFGGIEGAWRDVSGRVSVRPEELLKRADREIELAAAHGLRLVACGGPGYPERLAAIYDPPIWLSIRGEMDLTRRTVAVVGSRHATRYGLSAARSLARDLAAAGVAVVSGLALGIDAAAHEGALDGGGPTWAVLGGGILRLHPKANERLAARVAANGAVLSEYPLEEAARPEYFPARNRLVSGLAEAVIVVEASEKSGALITVDTALEQGRDVYAVPGPIDSGTSRGTNKLLKQGARPVTDASDVLDELHVALAPKTEVALEGPDERAIWDALSAHASTVDELIERAGVAPSRILAALTVMEMRGIVQQEPGKLYSKTERGTWQTR